MRNPCRPERLIVVCAAASLLAGCQQSDGALPFEVDEGQVAQLTIGPSGGVISLPSGLSVDFPAGALPGSVSLALSRMSDGPFPDASGLSVPGTAFHVGVPTATELAVPAHVQMSVDPALLDEDETLRLALAVDAGGSIPTFPGRYDAANGLLQADIAVLGDLAAVVASDVIEVGPDGPPYLAGGALPAPEAPATSGPSVSMRDGVAFTAACSPDGRPCHTGGFLRLWADAEVRERLGDRIVLMNPTIDASMDFISFDEAGVPMEVVGSIEVAGELRSRLGNVVTGYPIRTTLVTGPTTEALPTSLEIAGNRLVVGEVTLGDGSTFSDEEIEFSVGGVGTTTMLQVVVRMEIDFHNVNGTFDTGVIIAHLRLRR